MDNLTATLTYTSPHTGRVYDIVETPQSRVDYREFMNPETKYIREYTQYDFYLDGKQVTFTFDLDENHLYATFGELEGVFAPQLTSRFD